MKISKALTLREVAIYQLKIAGVTIETAKITDLKPRKREVEL